MTLLIKEYESLLCCYDEFKMAMVVVGVWEEEVGVTMEEVTMSEMAMSDGDAELEEGESAVATHDPVVVVVVAVAVEPGSWPY